MGLPAKKIAPIELKTLEKYVTLEEFRQMQAERDERLEYFDGRVVVGMAGTRRYHSRIIENVIAFASRGLRKRGCEISPESREVRTPDDAAVMLPDLVLQCSGADAPNDQAAYDPIALFEVLSPSTRLHDQVRKFLYCERIPSLRHYVLIEQEVMLVEHRSRPDPQTEWTTRLLTQPEDRMAFPQVPFDLSLAEIYEDVPVRGRSGI